MIGKNNIFNIRSGSRWLGSVGSTKGFVDFSSREMCIRACLVLLRNYRRRYGLRTIREVISRFAPPSENNTENYIRFVCDSVLMYDLEPINLDIKYFCILSAMAKMETNTILPVWEVLVISAIYNIDICE